MRTIIYNPSSKNDFYTENSNVIFYCIIDTVIKLEADLTFPVNSVLDFRGGCYTAKNNKTINLNSSQVFAPSYCIFGNLITITGFNNDSVKAEWFNEEGSNENEQNFINRAIEAAHGCPVVLEDRTYNLSGSIKFLDLGVFTRQSLIVPGTLQVTNDEPAIDLDQCSIDLKINEIKGFKTNDVPAAKISGGIIVNPVDPEKPIVPITLNGVGIKFSCSCFHTTIDIRQMHNLKYGLMFEPDGTRTKEVDGKTEIIYGGLQYIKINFQYIHAKYCIYVDIYSRNKPNELNTWLSELNVTGGRLEGDYGIYFSDYRTENDNSQAINGLYFSNIAFEGIDILPIRLRNVSSSRFVDLRLAESLPGLDPYDSKKAWVDMDNTSHVIMSWKGLVDTNRFAYGANCKWVIVEGFIHDDYRFDTTAFDRIVFTKNLGYPYDKGAKTQMVVTSSIQPYNMSKEILVEDGDKTLSLQDLFPEWARTHEYTTPKKTTQFKVIPRSLNTIVKNGYTLFLDFAWAISYVQCVFDINVILEAGAKLRINFIEPCLVKGNDKDGNEQVEASFYKRYRDITESGFYHVAWDADGNLVTIKV